MKHLVTVHNYYYPSSFIFNDEKDAINKYNELIAENVSGHVIRSKIEEMVEDTETYVNLNNEIDWTYT